MTFRFMLAAALLGSAAISAPALATPDRSDMLPAEPTEVRDRAMLERLRGNSGISLQWISWDYRGHVRVTEEAGTVHMSGEQSERGGRGRVTLNGDVLSIDLDHFVFRGHILIADTPDVGRVCERDGDFTFRITQNRRYWRLQEMEMCDGLTDYVDIYF